ncbi:MAG: hypothetical protein NTW29_22765 [Bacteroidetes bacterium]|nr:hypothetical protein [Bacteroidota bacterium]
MKRSFILIPALLLLFIAGIFYYPAIARYFNSRPVKEPDLLRKEMIFSIINPFYQADTLILETKWGFCGNSTPEEHPIIFETKFESEVYRRSLIEQINRPVLSEAAFYQIMDSVRILQFNGIYPPDWWHTCSMGKVIAEIKAEQLSPTKVRLYEMYQFANTIKSIQQEFIYKRNRWTYSLIDTVTQLVN